ncbi:MAG: TraB/GumN family protein, partial [Lysobacter sp.]
LKTFCLSALAVALLASPLFVPVHYGAAHAAVVSGTVKAPPVPLLWKVSDADNTVYLLGSFHLLKRDDYPLSKDIDTAFAAADKLVFEVPPSEMEDPATAQKALVHAGYGDARTLSKVLPPAMREKFNAQLVKRGASITQFDPFEPWFVNLTLVMGLSQSMGFRAEDGLDQHLMRRAASANKPTSGLETIEMQLQTLDRTPMKEQIASLREFVDEPEKMPGMLDDLHRAWRKGDVVQLDALTRGEMLTNAPETYRLINVARNDAWVPKIRKLLDESRTDDVLVVVGAMHLLGKDGVVEKLRGKGYRVERVCSACTADKRNAKR